MRRLVWILAVLALVLTGCAPYGPPDDSKMGTAKPKEKRESGYKY